MFYAAPKSASQAAMWLPPWRRAGGRPGQSPVPSALMIALCFLCGLAHAERPPVRVYGTADGLPSNQINCNRRDSHGFLWFCTPEGLSRFDGYTFTNYGIDQGLPDRFVTDFLETRHGEYWVGTGHGVARFDPKPDSEGAMFTAYGSSETGAVHALLEDRQGTVWIAAASGLFPLMKTNGVWSLRHANTAVPSNQMPENLLEDDRGNLWVALYNDDGNAKILRRSPSGRVDMFSDSFFLGNRIVALAQEHEGRIWLSTYNGLALVALDPRAGAPLIEHVYKQWDRQPNPEIGPVYQSSDGRVWVYANGRYQIVRDAQGQVHFKLYDRDKGGVALEDGAGNFWYGNRRTVRNGFTSYGHEDGLADENIHAVFEGQDRALYVVTGVHNQYIQRFDGKRFTSVAPKAPGHDASWDWHGWGWGQVHLQDHNGEWWMATGYELLRYPKVKRLEDLAHTSPKAIYREIHDVFRLYEDSHGDIWVASWAGSMRWERSTGRFRSFGIDLPEPTAFREDLAGNLWVGFWGGGLARYQQGHFAWIYPSTALPGSVFSLFLDHAGRLWAGTSRSGLVRFNDPTAEHPSYTVYSTKQGLSSNDVRAVTEDHFGKIYFWTGRGVDRLDPDSGRIRHYDEADGLVTPGADNNVAYCDRKGRLWFGLVGLSRFDPEPDRPTEPPPIRITRLRIRGSEYPVSELGEADLSGLILQPNDDDIQIEFASMNFAASDFVKYQYKLDGADSDWSRISNLRIVNYPHLSPGKYRFLVRGVNADGVVSPVPAAVGLRLLPPLWQRWWFLTVVGVVMAYVVYRTYRYRMQHLLELERVRTRIATDLHDDIGSSLTQIAIMSEVARRRGGDEQVFEPLTRIADLSRELVDSMSDIVWAINPKRDHLGDLAQRMRRFASDVLEGANIEVSFRMPQEWADIRVHTDVRREVFLVFKESVNNIVRHAQCTHVQVAVNLRSSELVMEIRDDGHGFRTATDRHGHGLVSMRERARRLGGKFEVTSDLGKGTTLTLTIPLNYSAALTGTFH